MRNAGRNLETVGCLGSGRFACFSSDVSHVPTAVPIAAPTATPAKGTPTAGTPTATASPDDSPDFEEDGPPAGVTDEEALASRLAESQLQLASLIDVMSQVDSLVQQNIDTGATALAKPAGPASGSPSESRSL